MRLSSTDLVRIGNAKCAFVIFYGLSAAWHGRRWAEFGDLLFLSLLLFEDGGYGLAGVGGDGSGAGGGGYLGGEVGGPVGVGGGDGA